MWRPSSKLAFQALENVQKRAIKWILDDYASCSKELYIIKCKQLDLLPVSQRLELFDLTFFHQIFYNCSPVKLPQYLTPYQGSSEQCHTLRGTSDKNQLPRNFENSYFYRAHLAWNRLPHDTRNTRCLSTFRSMVTDLFWKDFMESVHTDLQPD